MGLLSPLHIASTPIGRGWHGRSKWAALAISSVALAYDLWGGAPFANRPERWILAGLVVAALAGLPGGGWSAVGVTRRVLPEAKVWPRWLAFAGAWVTLLTLIAWAVFLAVRFAMDPMVGFGAGPSSGFDVWHSCVKFPLIEEALYRAALCAPWVACFGVRSTLCAGTLAFALLHWRYGNFAVNHVFAGFALTWIYLRSGNLWLAVLAHAAGNLALYGALGVLRQL